MHKTKKGHNLQIQISQIWMTVSWKGVNFVLTWFQYVVATVELNARLAVSPLRSGWHYFNSGDNLHCGCSVSGLAGPSSY